MAKYANSVQDREAKHSYNRGMRRKDLLIGIATLAGAVASVQPGLAADETARSVPNLGKPLHPPSHGPVGVGFVVGPNLVDIDLIGPMTAFGDADISRDSMVDRFDVYTIGPSKKPIDVGGMKAQPQYTFADAPLPHVLVVPMQDQLPETIAYIKRIAPHTDVTMSVCMGAFLVAKAGLFDGGRATTHHGGYDDFEKWYPKVQLIRGSRFVEDRNVSSSGGESCGIDLALRVVERYYGPNVAKAAAYNMEYRRTQRPQSIRDV